MLTNLLLGNRSNPRAASPDMKAFRQLESALAELPGDWLILCNGRAAAADGPPWVRFIALNRESGIALIDFRSEHPEAAVAPLEEFLGRTGFSPFAQGDPPIVAVGLMPNEISRLGDRIAEAFATAPPCGIAQSNWPAAIADLLMSTQGLLLKPLERNAKASAKKARPPERDAMARAHDDALPASGHEETNTPAPPAEARPEPRSTRPTETAFSVEPSATPRSPVPTSPERSPGIVSPAESVQAEWKQSPQPTDPMRADRPRSSAAEKAPEPIDPSPVTLETRQEQSSTRKPAPSTRERSSATASPAESVRAERKPSPRVTDVRIDRPRSSAAEKAPKPVIVIEPPLTAGMRAGRKPPPSLSDSRARAAEREPMLPLDRAETAAKLRRPPNPRPARAIPRLAVEMELTADGDRLLPAPRRERSVAAWAVGAGLLGLATAIVLYPHISNFLPSALLPQPAATQASNKPSPPPPSDLTETAALPQTKAAPPPAPATPPAPTPAPLPDVAAAAPPPPVKPQPPSQPALSAPASSSSLSSSSPASEPTPQQPPARATPAPAPAPSLAAAPPYVPREAQAANKGTAAAKTRAAPAEKDTRASPPKPIKQARARRPSIETDADETSALNDAQSRWLPPAPKGDETVTIDGTTYVKGREPHALGTVEADPQSSATEIAPDGITAPTP